MSKSPRTDAVWERLVTDTTGELEPDVEFSTLALQLEYELYQAKERIKRLEGELESTKADRDSWSNQSDEFAKTAADLMIRIQRLEKAGDEMERWCSDAVSADNWRKAKEIKP